MPLVDMSDRNAGSSVSSETRPHTGSEDSGIASLHHHGSGVRISAGNTSASLAGWPMDLPINPAEMDRPIKPWFRTGPFVLIGLRYDYYLYLAGCFLRIIDLLWMFL